MACRFKNNFLRQNGSPFVICTSTLMPFNIIFDKTPFLCVFVPSETPPKLLYFQCCGNTVFCILYTHNIQVCKYEYLNFHHFLPVRSTVVCFETTASFLSPCFSQIHNFQLTVSLSSNSLIPNLFVHRLLCHNTCLTSCSLLCCSASAC